MVQIAVATHPAVSSDRFTCCFAQHSETAYKGAAQEGYFDLIQLRYGYHTPLAMQIYQSLTASKHYYLVAKIPIHNSYSSAYY